MSDFRAYCDNLLLRARDAGWEVVSEKPLPYGRQYGLLQAGATKAVLSCYFGKKGFKFVPAGKAAAKACRASLPSGNSPVTRETMCMTWE